MPFKYLNKLVFAAALAISGGVYVLAKTAWEGLDEAVYMNPFLLMTVYVFYVWLIMPFNVRYVFAAARAPDPIRYKFKFLIGLAAIAALYEIFLIIEIGIIGHFINDDFIAARVVNYLIHLFLELNFFNALYAALCDKLKLAAARTITFSLSFIGGLLNHFGGEAVYKFNFLYFGMRRVSALNAAIVYIIVFGGCLILLLRKGRREYA